MNNDQIRAYFNRQVGKHKNLSWLNENEINGSFWYGADSIEKVINAYAFEAGFICANFDSKKENLFTKGDRNVIILPNDHTRNSVDATMLGRGLEAIKNSDKKKWEILIPVNTGGHWNLVKVEITKNDNNRYVINRHFYDPFGQGNRNVPVDAMILRQCTNIFGANNIDIGHSYTFNEESVHQTDSSSCGPVSCWIAGRLLKEEDLSVGGSFDYEAKDLRASQMKLIEQQKNNLFHNLSPEIQYTAALDTVRNLYVSHVNTSTNPALQAKIINRPVEDKAADNKINKLLELNQHSIYFQLLTEQVLESKETEDEFLRTLINLYNQNKISELTTAVLNKHKEDAVNNFLSRPSEVNDALASNMINLIHNADSFESLAKIEKDINKLLFDIAKTKKTDNNLGKHEKIFNELENKLNDDGKKVFNHAKDLLKAENDDNEKLKMLQNSIETLQAFVKVESKKKQIIPPEPPAIIPPDNLLTQVKKILDEKKDDKKSIKKEINNFVKTQDSANFYKPKAYCGIGAKTKMKHNKERKEITFEIESVMLGGFAQEKLGVGVGDVITVKYVAHSLNDEELKKEIISAIRNVEKGKFIESITVSGKRNIDNDDFFKGLDNDFIANDKVCKSAAKFKEEIDRLITPEKEKESNKDEVKKKKKKESEERKRSNGRISEEDFKKFWNNEISLNCGEGDINITWITKIAQSGANVNNSDFEDNHRFIQLLFPTISESPHNNMATTLSKDLRDWFNKEGGHSLAQQNFRFTLKNTLALYGAQITKDNDKLSIDFITDGNGKVTNVNGASYQASNTLFQRDESRNHNFDRITRIMKSCWQLGFYEEAFALNDFLVRNNDKIKTPKDTKSIWETALCVAEAECLMQDRKIILALNQNIPDDILIEASGNVEKKRREIVTPSPSPSPSPSPRSPRREIDMSM